MPPHLSTDLLVNHPTLKGQLCQWFREEWPAYYGPGGPGQAELDVARYSQAPSPGRALGMLIFADAQACGFMALKTEPFESYPQAGYWVGAAYVAPAWRRQGLGAMLLDRLESEAARLGAPDLWCATATADSLLLRQGWQLHQTVEHLGAPIRIFHRHVARRPQP